MKSEHQMRIPVKPEFAIMVHKAQDQAMQRVVVYTMVSRTTGMSHIKWRRAERYSKEAEAEEAAQGNLGAQQYIHGSMYSYRLSTDDHDHTRVTHNHQAALSAHHLKGSFKHFGR